MKPQTWQPPKNITFYHCFCKIRVKFIGVVRTQPVPPHISLHFFITIFHSHLFLRGLWLHRVRVQIDWTCEPVFHLLLPADELTDMGRKLPPPDVHCRLASKKATEWGSERKLNNGLIPVIQWQAADRLIAFASITKKVRNRFVLLFGTFTREVNRALWVQAVLIYIKFF